MRFSIMRWQNGLFASSLAVAGVWLIGPACKRQTSPVESAESCRDGTVFFGGGSFTPKSSVPQKPKLRSYEVPNLCVHTTEVTVGDIAQCVTQGACRQPRHWKEVEMEAKAHPVRSILWREARDYCISQRGRLPEMEEWEWLARAGEKGWEYPWGNDALPPTQLCVKKTGPCAVAAHPAGRSPQGVLGLEDNVAEWTETQLVLPDTTSRVYMGASYYGDVPYPAWQVFGSAEDVPSFSVGFRCVFAPESPQSRPSGQVAPQQGNRI